MPVADAAELLTYIDLALTEAIPSPAIT